jgi:hypothetical protein
MDIGIANGEIALSQIRLKAFTALFSPPIH